MKFCPKCGTQLDDAAMFCSNCGANFATNNVAAPQVDPYDHTEEFDTQDISDNKVYCMAIYLLGVVGIIIALLASSKSPYTAFHIRQGMKFEIVNILLTICAALLCWTIIVPAAAGICMVIVFVLKVIAFFQICKGKAKEPSIICKLGFLK